MSLDWRHHPGRHCAGLIETFDHEDTRSTVDLVKRCTRDGGCPVIWDCLKFAFDMKDQHAVLGGTGPRARAKALRALRAEQRGEQPEGGISFRRLYAELQIDVQVLVSNGGRRPRKCPQQETPKPSTAAA